MKTTVSCVLALCASIAPFPAMSWEQMTPQSLLNSSDLIAVVDVGDIHEATTPEGLKIRSAKAKIVDLVYGGAPSHIHAPLVIYSFDPNAYVTSENFTIDGASPEISQGRAFVCLKMRGLNKFYPYQPISFQLITPENTVKWPAKVSKPGDTPYPTTPLPEAIKSIQALLPKKAEQGAAANP